LEQAGLSGFLHFLFANFAPQTGDHETKQDNLFFSFTADARSCKPCAGPVFYLYQNHPAAWRKAGYRDEQGHSLPRIYADGHYWSDRVSLVEE